jgi:general secretion pathway protein I
MHARNHQLANARPVTAFTLVEVMVALAIFGMAVVVLGAAYINVLNGYDAIRKDQVREEELAFVFARIMAHQVREDFEAGGTIDTLHAGRFSWIARLERTGVADLFDAEITVTLPEREVGGRRGELTKRALIYRPGWEDAAERDRLRLETRERLEDSRNERPGNV